jgi:hypothetical protein
VLAARKVSQLSHFKTKIAERTEVLRSLEVSNQAVRTTIEGRVKEIERLSFEVPKMKETDAQIESTCRDKVRGSSLALCTRVLSLQAQQPLRPSSHAPPSVSPTF